MCYHSVLSSAKAKTNTNIQHFSSVVCFYEHVTILLDILKYGEQYSQPYIATLSSLGVQRHLIDQHQIFCFLIFKGYYYLSKLLCMLQGCIEHSQKDKTSN